MNIYRIQFDLRIDLRRYALDLLGAAFPHDLVYYALSEFVNTQKAVFGQATYTVFARIGKSPPARDATKRRTKTVIRHRRIFWRRYAAVFRVRPRATR